MSARDLTTAPDNAGAQALRRRVHVIGDGGREAAIRWKVAADGHTLVDTVEGADLVIVGPEQPLADGIVDELSALGIPCFGPRQAVAQIEASKAYARGVADALGLPSPRHSRLTDIDGALDWYEEFGRPVVVKYDGLASGKGVIVPNGDDETIDAIRLLGVRGPILLEERLIGHECTLLAFCDGVRAVPMPLSQDHKRLGEGDVGPNTGGMGAYAPAPVGYSADELCARFVQPVVDHLAAHGTPYVGVLYAGLMICADGPRLIEFNCRFGDPETQVVLPLLESDLVEIALACVEGRLDPSMVRWRDGAACTVVAAAPGYPHAPAVGSTVELGEDVAYATVFLAGARQTEQGLVTSGGRVLSVTGVGADLGDARRAAYARLANVRFDGMQVRRDIAWRAPGTRLASYAAAGVDIDEGNLAVAKLKAAVERTHNSSVLGGIGAFGGGLDISALKAFDHPVLVASTDGVGTKVELAARAGRPGGVGADIVNHCIDDVLVQGATPLFFLDYIAASVLDSDHVAAVVTAMAGACEAAGCVLLGGETAEMPGVYQPGAFDIAGTLVGVVDKAAMLPRPGIVPGDVLVGLASSGPHTNGYSFLRKLFAWMPLDVTPAGLDRPLGDALLEPHRSYLPVLRGVLADGRVKALAHITGGGLIENLPRALPDGVGAEIRLGSWPVPPLFRLVQQLAVNMDVEELHRTLNMGIGMVLVVGADDVADVQAALGEESWVIGELVAGDRRVQLR